jgi:hypothetical protein
MFIGAAGSFTFNQRQIDIEFAPGAPGAPHRRLVHVCVGQGLAFLHTEVHGMFGWISTPAAGIVEVHDRGFSGGPAFPAPGVARQPLVVVAGGGPAVPLLTAGFIMPFGRRLVVSHPPPIPLGPVFLYVPHLRPHSQMAMVPDPNGLPVPFMHLKYGGHVQNWRKMLF